MCYDSYIFALTVIGGVSMKNHIKVNGQIRQTHKKWSHLRQQQKERISNWLRKEYTKFVQLNHRMEDNIGI